jgi:hypothetical protein
MSTCDRRHCTDEAVFEVHFGTPPQKRLLCRTHTNLYWLQAAPPVRVAPIPATVVVHDEDDANALMTGSEQCDRCGARAYVACVTRSQQELLFCGHCYGKYEAGLVQIADVIIHDCRSLLHA